MKKSIPIIIAIVGFVLELSVVGAVAWHFLYKADTQEIYKEDEIQVQQMDADTGSYMMLNVPEDHCFEIQSKGSERNTAFSVMDIEGRNVATKQDVRDDNITILPPEEGYEAGEFYSISLGNKGTFKDKKLKNAKEVLFCIKRKEALEVEYADGVKKVSGRKIQIEGDRITLDGTFAEGDIVVSDINKDDIDEVYVLDSVDAADGKTTAQLGKATPDQVYEKLDIFFYHHINMSEVEVDEEKFKGVLIETGIADAFIDSSYAADDLSIEVEKREGTDKNEFIFDISITDPTAKGREIKISFGIRDDLLAKITKKTAAFDNTVTITSGIELTVKGADKKDVEKRISEALRDYAANNSVTDDVEQEIPLVPIVVPIAGPVAAYIDIGLNLESEYSTEFNAGIENKVLLKQGVIYDLKKWKIKKLYGDVSGDVDAHILVKGKLDASVAAFVEAGVEVPAVISVGLEAQGGPYLEAEGCFSIQGIPDDIDAKGYYRTELGVFLNANITLEPLWFDEEKIKLTKKKLPIYEKSKYLKVKDVSIQDRYFVIEGRVPMKELTVEYENVISGETESASLKEYRLYIDEEEIPVEDGMAMVGNITGTHEVKVKWKQKGNDFVRVKDVEFMEEKDYIESIFLRSMDEIDEDFGPLSFLMAERPKELPGNSKKWYYSEGTGLRYGFRTVGGNRELCYDVAGTAEQLFGISKPMTQEEFDMLFQCLPPQNQGYGEELPGASLPTVYAWFFGIKPEDDPWGYGVARFNMVYRGAQIRYALPSRDAMIYPDTICGIDGLYTHQGAWY